MFHDLGVSIPQQGRNAATQTLQRLGYDVVAFTTTIKGLQKLNANHVPYRESYDKFKETRNNIPHPDQKKRQKGLRVLERVTLVIEDASQLGIFNSPELNKFDLVAVYPTSEKILQQCLQFDFDIISLPIDSGMMFQVKRPHIHVAVEKGMLFEIAYAVALRDSTRLRWFVSNASSIAKATSGKHLLLTSGAGSTMELRAPLDVINLMVLLNVPQQCARHAVVENAQAIVTHGDVRARVCKGIVKVRPIDDVDETKTTRRANNRASWHNRTSR